MTAHAAQGQTLKKGAIVDLRLGKGTKAIASYVALTRVKSRHDLLIYRPFEIELFRKGPLQGPTLLLRVLRGEVCVNKVLGRRRTRFARRILH